MTSSALISHPKGWYLSAAFCNFAIFVSRKIKQEEDNHGAEEL